MADGPYRTPGPHDEVVTTLLLAVLRGSAVAERPRHSGNGPAYDYDEGGEYRRREVGHAYWDVTVHGDYADVMEIEPEARAEQLGQLLRTALMACGRGPQLAERIAMRLLEYAERGK